MSLSFFDNFKFDKLNKEQINKNLDQQYQKYKDEFARILKESSSRYNRANFWSKLHLLFGFLASITSLISLILTLSNNTFIRISRTI